MSFPRNHIDPVTRMVIGLGVYLNKGVYGYITEQARDYFVSRWFIYYCYFQFLLHLGSFDSTQIPLLSPLPVHQSYLSLEECVLSLYLEGESSVNGIQRSLESLFRAKLSSGRISEILNEYGSLLPESESGVSVRLNIVSDEIFANGDPALVSVEPISDYILQLKAVETRDQETWGICWLEIVDNETGQVDRVICDEGTGLVGGIKLTFSDGVHQSDLFHVILRLAYLKWVFEKRAYRAIEATDEAESKFDSAKSEKSVEKRFLEWQEAYEESEKCIGLFDDFDYLFKELQKALAIVNMETGKLRTKEEAIAHLCAVFSLMEELEHEKIAEGIQYFRKHQESVLRYFDQVKKSEKLLKDQIQDEVLRHILILIYAYTQKTYTAYGQRKKKLKERIEFWQKALCEWISPEQFRSLYALVETTLSQIIRSSSVVENTNSRLRRFFDSARGQINQNRLNLIRFYLNHKVFERGRRKGKSPAQIFFQEAEKPLHWLSILREKKIQKAAA